MTLRERLLARGRRQEPPAEPEPEPEPLRTDFPRCVEAAFPDEFPIAWSATEQVIDGLSRADLSGIDAGHPALRDFDWENYLRCSVARVVRAVRALRARVPPGGNVLDFGAYFGNVSLAARRSGFAVDALDAYADYGEIFRPFREQLTAEGVRILDFADSGWTLGNVPSESYDAVLLLGVIEHIPHTPRPALEGIVRALRPGGLLVLDTPNHAYGPWRWKLERGESVYSQIETQFHSDIPFQGHHREYTVAEVEWMVGQVGLVEVVTDTFDYSRLSLEFIQGDVLRLVEAGEEDPTMREVILTTGVKPPVEGDED